MEARTDGSSPALPDSREQARALAVASLGGMLEYFEFIIFVFLAHQISLHFSSPDMPEWVRLMQTFGIFAAGYIVRPIGGILMAQIGDRVGRKRIFTITLAMMALPTLIIGLLPGYAQIGVLAPILLLLCRVVQGISIAGELPGAISFVSEQVTPRRLSLALGVLAASMCLGSLFGSMVIAGLVALMGEQAMNDWGWRLPFIIGGLFGFVSVYLRRFTHETPIFEAMKQRRMLSSRPPVSVLLREHRGNLVAAMILCGTVVVMTATLQQFPLTYLVSMKGMPLEAVAPLQTLLIAMWLLGNLLSGALLTLPGVSIRNACVLMLGALALLMLWAFRQTDPEALRLPFILLGLCAGMTMALSLTLLARSFPAPLRYTGIATGYNVPASLMGGTALLVLTWLSHLSLDWMPWYPVLLCGVAAMATLYLWPRLHPIDPFAPTPECATPEPDPSVPAASVSTATPSRL